MNSDQRMESAALRDNIKRLETSMWKLVVGFIVFAAVSLFVIMKAGDKVDMGGEKHGAEAVHVPDTAPAAVPASAASAP